MHRSLGAILTDAEGILLPQDAKVDVTLLDSPVQGLEFYQPGTATDYTEKLVFVTVPVDDQATLDTVSDACETATGLIVPSSTPRHLSTRPQPVLLRSSSWATTDTLVRTLTEVVAEPEAPGRLDQADDTVTRDRDFASRRRDSALLALLAGTADTAIPASIVGLRLDQDHVVIAAGIRTDDIAWFRHALAAEFPDERDVVSESHLLAAIPVAPGDEPRSVVERLRARFVNAGWRRDTDLPIGVGTVVPGVLRLHESASAARLVLRALNVKIGLRPLTDNSPVRVAEAADVEDALAIIQAADALRPYADSFGARLRILMRYDIDHRTDLLPTVLSALKQQTNVAAAARPLGIHPNSFRARLERITEISGIDLNDHAMRLRTILAFVACPEIHNAALRGSWPDHMVTD